MNFKNLCLIQSAIIVCSITSTYAQDKSQSAGIVFNGGVALNKTIVDAIDYIGTCPGFYQKKIVGWFRDKEVPTAKNRRVRIINDTLTDISQKIPYTDRKYKRDDGRSKKIYFDFGTSHRSRRFVVKDGLNKFSYMIYDGKYGKSNMQIIKQGNFSVQVNANLKQRQRDIVWRNTPRFVCLNQDGEVMKGKPLDNCEFPGVQRVGSCDGKKVYGEVKPARKVKRPE